MKRPLLWILGVWIMGEMVAFGMGISFVPVTSLDRYLGDRESARVQIIGTVKEFRRTSSGYAYVLSDTLLQGSGTDDPSSAPAPSSSSSGLLGMAGQEASAHVLVYSDDISDCRIGYRLQVSGTLALFGVPSNPGQFDTRAYYEAQGLRFSLRESRRRVLVQQVRRLPQYLWDLREALRESLLEVSGGGEAGVFLSLFLGDRSSMDPEVKDLYQIGGISHILAISGLHVSLFGMALHEVLRKLSCPFLLNLGVSGGILACYVAMTGGAPSARRALIMFLVFLVSKAVGRSYDLLSALSLAGLLLLAEQPLLLRQSSFQLSFLAMIGVGGLWPAWEEKWGELWGTQDENEGKVGEKEKSEGENDIKVGSSGCKIHVSCCRVGTKRQTAPDHDAPVGDRTGGEDRDGAVVGGSGGVLTDPCDKVVDKIRNTCNNTYKVGNESDYSQDFGMKVGEGAQNPRGAPSKAGAGRQTSHNAASKVGVIAGTLGRRAAGAVRGAPGKAVLFSLIIQLATMPVTAWHYFVIPVYSPLLNPLVLPFTGLLLGAVALTAALGTLGGAVPALLSGFSVIPARAVLLWFEGLCRLSARLPGSSLIVGRPRWWQILLYYVVLLTGQFLLKRGRLRGLRIVRWVLLLFLLMQPIPERQLQITSLDVGQGDCTFLRCPGGTCCLIDGGSSSVSDVGKRRILPFLESRGVRRLTGIFVTHGDADHINGLSEVLADRRIPVGALFVTQAAAADPDMGELLAQARSQGVPIRVIRQGMNWEWDGVSFTCLYPSSRSVSGVLTDKNDTSLVLQVSAGTFTALFAGDMEERGERELLADGSLSPVDLLKVGHHGSRSSTCAEFLAATSPDLALISVGANNSYGHPHRETLERLEEAGTRLLRTDTGGALTLRADHEGVRVETFLP